MAEINPARWKCRSDNHNISIYVEKGPSGGLILTRPNGQKDFIFAESKITTVREFGRMLMDIADWADDQKENSGSPMDS
jgi:hypothetical protein